MALIKCPECGKEVSDKAGKCPNCGCPITTKNDSNRQYTKVNGVEYDVTEITEIILNAETYKEFDPVSDIIRNMMDIAPIEFIKPTRELGRAPEEINCETLSDFSKRQRAIQASKIHCPNCRSTDVYSGSVVKTQI